MKAYQVVTDRIISLLEQEIIPWRQPWAKMSAPINLHSKREYHGVNFLLLSCAGYPSNAWLTFNQAKELGGNIRKGEHGLPIVFWKMLQNEEGEEFPMARYSTVFNTSQCEGIAYQLPESKVHERIQTAEEIFANMPNAPKLIESDRAAWHAERDVILMPPLGLFENTSSYYAVLFHECIHATGHASRLNRRGESPKANSMRSEAYAKEELIAEIGAAFLCAAAGIDNSDLPNRAAYIKAWLQNLKADNTLIVSAAGKAQKACDYILGKSATNEVTNA